MTEPQKPRDAATHFLELAENIEDVFYIREAGTGCMRYVSPAYANVWGKSCDSLYADPGSYKNAIHPEDAAALQLAHRANEDGRASDIEYRLIREDGAVRWIRDLSYPVMNGAGMLERVVGSARDITGRKTADIELARINRALQMLSDCNKALTRIDDEPQLLHEVCRLAVEKGGYRMAWVGYARRNAEGTIEPMAHVGCELGYLSEIEISWHDYHPAGDGPAGRTLRTGEAQFCPDIESAPSFLLWREQALGRGYKSLVVLPLREGDRVFGLLGLYSAEAKTCAGDEAGLLQELADNLAFGISGLRARSARRISEQAARRAAEKVQRAREEILRLNASLEQQVSQRTEQLESANKQLEAFSFSLSHDLRTPLSTIDGFSSLLEKALARAATDDSSMARHGHYIKRIRSGVAQMGETIEAMLSLAVASRSGLRCDIVNLSTLAEELLRAYQEREPERICSLHVEPGLQAWGDEALLRQVLDNLLGNAWKFSKKSACTHIRFASQTDEAGKLVFFVHDQGAGFDMAQSDKLFTSFNRLHPASEFEGTGIGLATTKRIVEHHGGSMWAESAPGQGATFYFTLAKPLKAEIEG